MEPFVVPLHSSTPPQLDEDDDGEAGSEDDEFGGLAGPTEPPPKLKLQPPDAKVDALPPNRNQSGPEGNDGEAESSSHLTNGYSEEDNISGARGASAAGTLPLREETGFADFTVFTEQAAHPWCCGFSPSNGTESWAGEHVCRSGQEVVLDSEPRSQCASEAKGSICTKVKQHCELPSQDRPPPQDAEGASGFRSPWPRFGEEDSGEDRWRENRHLSNYLRSVEMQEDKERSIPSIPQTISLYECASEELESDFSFEGVSADLEPIVSSLASQDDQTDWDPTDAEDEEELGNSWSSFGRTGDPGQSEADEDFHTQETSATSNWSHSASCTPDGFVDGPKHHRDPGCDQTADVSVQSLGGLPPSDSFADFCSAPSQGGGGGGGGGGLWAEFQDHSNQEKQLSQQTDRDCCDGITEEGANSGGTCGVSRRNSCQALVTERVQQLICNSFPDVTVPPEEDEEEEKVEEEKEEEEVPGLCSLLHNPESGEEEEERKTEPSCDQWAQRSLWWPHQDLHSAVGLRFQWGGSHANRTLLRCLGVDTRNIVFLGMKKEPVAVPAFASGLGMLEPTKDAVPAVCTSGDPAAVTAPQPAGPSDTPEPPKDSAQGALSSSQLGWSSHGLSSSQDGCFALNLDYFGSEEESRSSSSSSSRSNSPPPPPSPPSGVDRELYELTISKLDTSSATQSGHLLDTLSRLMSVAEMTSTSFSKPSEEEELSVEAGSLTATLPDLSFMKAKVLMFPSVLVPEG